MTEKKNRAPRFLLLMSEDVRIAIEREAFAHGRTVTKEINIRLADSLKLNTTPGIAPVPPQPAAHSPQAHSVTVLTTAPDDTWAKAGDKLHPTDTAMLKIFRALPADKQLALLTLFK